MPWCLPVILIAAFLESLSCGTEPASMTTQELKAAILAEWSHLSKIPSSARADVQREYWRSSAGKPFILVSKTIINDRSSPAGFVFLFERAKYDENSTVEDLTEELEMTNTRYKASLRKDRKSNKWVLVSFENTESPIMATYPYNGLYCRWFVCGNVSLPDWISDDCFAITRIEPTGEAARFIRVHFAHDSSKRSFQQDRAGHIIGGFIDFDPSHHYIVMGYQYSIRSSVSAGIERGNFTYDLTKKVPVLKGKTEERPEFKGRGETYSTKETYSYIHENDVEIPDEEFRLSYYGLPEPIGVEWTKPTPNWVWLLFAAGACTVLAIGMRFAARRLSRSAT